jgi:general L-amino acid transport system substrate-binding protein
MRKWALLLSGILLVCAVTTSIVAAGTTTIQDIGSRHYLKCGVLHDYAGFGYIDAKGNYQGFDVDFCRAIAAALGVEVRYTNLTGKTRFPALQSNEVDVVLMLVTETMSRETALGLDFPTVNFYDGQTYMVRKNLGVTSTTQLNGASICATSGTTGEVNTADFFRKNRMTYKPVMFERLEDSYRAYDEGRCDAVIGQSANLYALRAELKNPAEHVVLTPYISKEPMGPVTRGSDRQWTMAVKFIVHALLLAEELGVTQANVQEMAKSANDPEVRRMLGADGSLGPDAALPKDFAFRAIRAVGNYGEIFERNLGQSTKFKMERGLNAMWSKGGLYYPIPFK